MNLQFFVRKVLPEFVGDPLEVVEGDLSGVVVVEKLESLQDLLLRVLLRHLRRHQIQKVLESEPARVVLVHLLRNSVFVRLPNQFYRNT